MMDWGTIIIMFFFRPSIIVSMPALSCVRSCAHVSVSAGRKTSGAGTGDGRTDHGRDGAVGGLGVAQKVARRHLLREVLFARGKGGAVDVVPVDAKDPCALQCLPVCPTHAPSGLRHCSRHARGASKSRADDVRFAHPLGVDLGRGRHQDRNVVS